MLGALPIDCLQLLFKIGDIFLGDTSVVSRVIADFKSIAMQLGDLFPRHVVRLVCGKVESLRNKKCSAEAVAFEDWSNGREVRLGRIVKCQDDQLVGNWFKGTSGRGQGSEGQSARYAVRRDPAFRGVF